MSRAQVLLRRGCDDADEQGGLLHFLQAQDREPWREIMPPNPKALKSLQELAHAAAGQYHPTPSLKAVSAWTVLPRCPLGWVMNRPCRAEEPP